MVKTTREIKKIIVTYLKNLKKKKVPVSKIILYGSYATNKATSCSDIDLVVISPYFKQMDFFDRLIILGRARIDIGLPMEILGYSSKEYEYCEKGTFLNEIKRTGKIIYSNPRIK